MYSTLRISYEPAAGISGFPVPRQLGEGKKITGWPVLGGWERTGSRVAQFDPCTTAAAAFRLRVRYEKSKESRTGNLAATWRAQVA
jgi:hypothetical protein